MICWPLPANVSTLRAPGAASPVMGTVMAASPAGASRSRAVWTPRAAGAKSTVRSRLALLPRVKVALAPPFTW
jgi:hypothetical protein